MNDSFQSRSIVQSAERPILRVRRTKKKWHAFFSALSFAKILHIFSSKKNLLKLCVAMSILGVFYVGYLWFTLPDVSDPTNFLASQSTVITDRHGTELYRVFQEENRTYIPGELIPDSMKKAIVAIEDKRFYDRGCLDVVALGRVVLYLGKAGGASTLTRQLARNALSLKHENVLNRKLKELALGCFMEHEYSKEEILALYLNWIPFGENAYGVEQASKVYFNSSAQALTIAQSAILASLPQRPTYFSPYGNHVRTQVSTTVAENISKGKITTIDQIPEADITIGLLGSTVGTGSNVLYIGGRTDQVLKNMEEQGFITSEERHAALQELVTIQFNENTDSIKAAHFVLWVRNQVQNILSTQLGDGVLERGGLTVETTLDYDVQKIAEDLLQKKKDDMLTLYGAHNMSLLSVDPVTRQIIAYAGNVNYSDTEHGGKIDMIQVPRQPGSSFKPFVYLSAFKNGYSPATVLYDVPTKIGDDEPQNYDAKFMGPVSIRTALNYSRNIPAAKAFFLGGGEDEIIDLVSNLGAPTPKTEKNRFKISNPDYEYGWPLALGAAETPMLEMVQAYTTLANEGEYKPLVSILSIKDKDGNILYTAEKDTVGTQVLDKRLVYQLVSVMSDSAAKPDGFWRNQLTLPGMQTAAKTGTSNKCLERTASGDCKLRKPDNAWTLGFTPNLVTGVWMGNADSSAMFDKADGLTSASPIWHDFMIRAHKTLQLPAGTFVQPSGIVTPQISLLSGQLPAECTPIEKRGTDVFLDEKMPTLEDPACQLLTVDKVTGLLASDTCPVEAQEQKPFFVAHSIAAERWPLWEVGVQDWAKKQKEVWDSSETHSGSLLPLPLAPTENCDPTLTPGRLDKPKISFTSPTSIATYPAFIAQVQVESKSNVQNVVYELDSKVVETSNTYPYAGTIRVPRSLNKDDSHVLKATVTDEYFNQASAEVTIRFGEDTSKPTVSLVSPLAKSIVFNNDTLKIEANAFDTEGGIKYVQFYLDDILLTTKPIAPYTLDYTLNVTSGTHKITARAFDLAGQTLEDSVSITVLSEDEKSMYLNGTAGSLKAPTILLPAETNVSLSLRDSLPIVFGYPALNGTNMKNISLQVLDSSHTVVDTIFTTSSLAATSSERSWRPHSVGTFTVELSTTDTAGIKQVWEKVLVTVH